jgi:hypothetical protein
MSLAIFYHSFHFIIFHSIHLIMEGFNNPIGFNTLHQALTDANFDEEEEESTIGRIQQLELGMSSMNQQLSTITNILTDLQTQMSSRRQSDVSSTTSSMVSTDPSSLFNTGLICFVAGGVQNWLPVFKKHSHTVLMYTRRADGQTKTLSTAQVRTLKHADGTPYIAGSS